MITDDHSQSKDMPASATDPRAAPLPTLDTRWLWSVAVVVPVLLSAGVYWIHSVPAGRQAASGAPTVEVRLVHDAPPEPTPALIAPTPAASQGSREPMVEAPNRPIPEETSTAAVAPAAAPSVAPTLNSRPSPSTRQQPISSGAASAFQRELLNHIARFRRYPGNALSGQHGVAQVMFAMRRDGIVSEVWVWQSSGHVVLDEAAAQTIRRAQPLPPIPPDLPDQLTILIPVEFDPP